MEHENYPEDVWNALSYTPPESLFEEGETTEPEEKASPLEGRVEAMEYRLGRALLCLNQCQKDLAKIQKWCRELTREQDACRSRQEHHQKITRYSVYIMIGLILAGQIKSLAALGWQLLDKLAQLLNVKPEMVSGVLLVIVILWLAVKLTRMLVQKVLSFSRKGGDDHAVRNR